MDFTVFPDEKFAAMRIFGERQITLGQTENPALVKVGMMFPLAPEKLQSRVNQQGAEDIQNEMKLFHGIRAQKNKNAPEDNRPQDAPE